MAHEGHVINDTCISGHARVESDLSKDEENRISKFGRIGSTPENTKNGVIRLFMNRTYDSSLICRIF